MQLHIRSMIHWQNVFAARVHANESHGRPVIYRPVLCATTISVKCVTVEATAKASFDFSLVTINLWFMPLRVEYAHTAGALPFATKPCVRSTCRENRISDHRHVRRTFYFVRYPGDANRRIPRRMPKELSQKSVSFSRALTRLSLSLLPPRIPLPKVLVKSFQ